MFTAWILEDLLSFKVSSPILLAIASTISFLLSILLFTILCRQITFKQRLAHFSYLVFYLWFSFLCAGLIYTHFIKAQFTEHKTAKSMILVVVDAMPANFYHSYNPSAKEQPVEKWFKEGLIYNNVYTKRPWTNAYFYSLYRGNDIPYPHGMLTTNSFSDPGKKNLLHLLQKNNVAVKVISFHRTSMPETLEIFDYKGLRSYLLGVGTSWIPAMLGLDYNMTIPSKFMNNQHEDGKISNYFYLLANKSKKHEDPFLYLLPEIDRIKKHNERFLIIFHIRLQYLDDSAAMNSKRIKNKAKYVRIMSNHPDGGGSRYNQEDKIMKAIANQFYDRTEAYIQAFSDKLLRFKQMLSNDYSDLPIIVTSDHGIVHDKGYFGYISAPEEEVLKVPFIILNGSKQGVSSNMYSTPDITQTILDFYDVDEKLDPDAISMINPSKQHSYLTALTSVRNSHWYVLIYHEGLKYRFNIHPVSDGKWSVSQLIIPFQEEIINEGYNVNDLNLNIQAILKETLLEEIGESAEFIHYKYRALL